MNTQQIADELWRIVYETFESNAGLGPNTAGGGQQKSEVQFRLMGSIAELKATKVNVPHDLLGRIEADVQLSNAMNWMNEGTRRQMLELLATIKESEWR